MLRDIVEGVLRIQPDMQLVAPPQGVDLVEAIGTLRPDIVVVAEPWAGGYLSPLQLLGDERHLKVLVVTGDGREAHLVELESMPIDDVSPGGLVDAIRAACTTSAIGKE